MSAKQIVRNKERYKRDNAEIHVIVPPIKGRVIEQVTPSVAHKGVGCLQDPWVRFDEKVRFAVRKGLGVQVTEPSVAHFPSGRHKSKNPTLKEKGNAKEYTQGNDRASHVSRKEEVCHHQRVFSSRT
jgi:hypothetical protein